MERKLALDSGRNDSMMYENLRKGTSARPIGATGKLVQDIKQPHSGNLIEDNKRFNSLQRYGKEAKDDIDRFVSLLLL